MNYVFVDTGAWYPYLDRKDPDHHLAAGILEQYSAQLLTTNFVMDEAITLLRYRAGTAVAIQFGELLFSGAVSKIVHVSRQDQQKAWKLFQKYNGHCFSYTDCTSFVVINRLKISTTIAFDSDFREYGLHCLPDLQ